MSEPTTIPADMPRTESFLVHPVDGWEAENTLKPNLGVLRIAKVPGSTMIGLFIRMDAIMFPLAYFRNWHAAHRFTAWMEATEEPKPTMAEEYGSIMERAMKGADNVPGMQATIQGGSMTFEPSGNPIGGKLPPWRKDIDTDPPNEAVVAPKRKASPKGKRGKP